MSEQEYLIQEINLIRLEYEKVVKPYIDRLVYLKRIQQPSLALGRKHPIEGKHMTTIEFYPVDWDTDGFDSKTDRIEVDYQWHEADASVGLLPYLEKTVKWMRNGKEFKDITDELSYNDLAYLKREIEKNDKEIASERTD